MVDVRPVAVLLGPETPPSLKVLLLKHRTPVITTPNYYLLTYHSLRACAGSLFSTPLCLTLCTLFESHNILYHNISFGLTTHISAIYIPWFGSTVLDPPLPHRVTCYITTLIPG